MKKFVLTLLATAVAAPLLAGDENVKVQAKDCPAACTEKTAATCTEKTAANKIQLKVSNVACEESCSALSKTIAGLEGVKSQAVCAQSHTASIEIEPGKTCAKTLTTALTKAGYKVEGQQVSLKVTGMTCGGCATGLSTALTKTEGVVENKVCHTSGTAQVLFNPEKIDTKKVIALITKEGYTVEQ